MPKIEKWIVDKVIEAADIEEVVGDFVQLRRAGVNRTGLCPFHDDEHDGNFIVRPKGIRDGGNTFRCFVCGAKGDAVAFLKMRMNMNFPDAIRWIGRKYNIEVDNVPLDYTPPPPKPLPPPPPPLEIPRLWVKRTMDIAAEGNVFCEWIKALPWNDGQRSRIDRTLYEYCVGGWKDGRVVFWLIDHEGIPRSAKLMRYLSDGHRDHNEHPGWIYNQEVCRRVLDPASHSIEKPLFGAHLLKRYPDAMVHVVESEKTALILSNFYGQPEKELFLACGGLSHMRLEAMQPLVDQGRTVWLWPDKDGVEKWQQLAEKLGSEKVNVYTRFYDTCWREVDGDKADAADITIRMMTTGEMPTENDEETGTAQPDETELRECEVYAEQHPDEPFMDAAEMADPWLHWARNRMREMHKTDLTIDIEGVKSIGELIEEHPILKRLF